MPYHVEARRSRRYARLFNLDDAELRRVVLEPWERGRPLTLADQQWERRETQLRILEGPELSGIDLAHGEGWNSAERTARDVTQTLLRRRDIDAVAALVATSDTSEALAAVLDRLGLQVVEWASVRRGLIRWITDASSPTLEVAAVIVACPSDRAPGWWLFDAGLAVGALGPRAILVQFADSPLPAALRDLEVLRLDLGPDGDFQRLSERLRRVGCEIPKR